MKRERERVERAALMHIAVSRSGLGKYKGAGEGLHADNAFK